MSREDDVELSPLHRLKTKVEQRLESNEKHADRHPDPNVRYDCKVRVQAYRLVLAEVRDAIVEVAKSQVERAVEGRAKQQAIVNAQAIAAMSESSRHETLINNEMEKTS